MKNLALASYSETPIITSSLWGWNHRDGQMVMFLCSERLGGAEELAPYDAHNYRYDAIFSPLPQNSLLVIFSITLLLKYLSAFPVIAAPIIAFGIMVWL